MIQSLTHVDLIGNLRMLSHCAGVAPADCPEYSKRPEHNPNVCSLDCCSKFRSLMTVASGVFERNIAHVFNLRCSLLIYTTSVWATYRDPSWRVGDTSPGGPLGHLLETAGPRTPREREIGHLHNIHLVRGRRGLCHSWSFSSRQSRSYLWPLASQSFNMFELLCHVL